MNSRLVVLLAIVSLLSLAGFASPVYAHANLIRSDPPANSVIPTSPHQITLVFSEQVEQKFTGAAVYESSGKQVDTGYHLDPTDPTVLIITLATLPPGVYTVTWHAISAVDGHHTSGSFPFGVGNVTINVQPNSNPAYSFPSPIEVADRWLNLLADTIFLGGSIFTLLVWIPTVANRRDKSTDALNRKMTLQSIRMLTGAAVVALFATILSLIIQAYTVAGSSSLTDITGEAYTIVSSTRIGTYWTLRMTTVLAAICASTLVLRTKKLSRASFSLLLTVGLLLSLSTSLTSHNAAATSYFPALNLLSDWIHLVAVGAWVGGLACLVLTLTAFKELNGKVLAELIRRFSSVALVSVGVIGLTGLYNLLLEVGSLSALFSTAYGQILLVKLSIFAPMIAFGAINQFALYDHIVAANAKSRRTGERRAGRSFNRFKLSIRSEISLGIILLLVVGILTASSPVAQTSTTAPPYQAGPMVLRGYSIEGVNVTLKIYPFQVGDNHFEVDFTDPQGAPVTNVKSVSVKFNYLDKNIGVSTATAQPNQGAYSFDGTYLSFAGNWRLEVWAQRTQGYDVIVPFQVDIPELSVRFSELPLSSSSEPYGITIDNHDVVWFAETGTGQIASYTPATGTLRQYTLPHGGSRPFYLTNDENGSIWISDTQFNLIVRFDTKSATFNEYAIPTAGSVPGGIITDAAGNVWFTEEIGGKIGRLVPNTGVITEFQIPTNDSIPIQVAVDQRGTVWFTESKGGKIGRLDPLNGAISEFPITNSTLLGPTGIAVAPNGEVWITEHGGNRVTMFNSANQTFKTYQLSNNQAFPFGLAFYQENRIWFVEHIGNSIATLDLTNGRVDTFPIPNPSSDVQLLAVDSKGNAWFTLPAIGVLGVLTPTTSGLQLQSNSSSDALAQLVLIAAVIIIVTVPIILVLGQRRMRRRTASLRVRQ